MTQAELAQRIGRTQTAVSYWEAAKRTPGLDDLLDVASATGKNVYFFLPPNEPSQAVSAILRAETVRLNSHELTEAVDRLIDRADGSDVPDRELEIRSTQPAHAANELIELAELHGPRVDVNELARRCGALVIPHPFPDALSGLLLITDDGAIIGVNSNHADVRQRFSAAHELSHLLLSHGEKFHIDITEGAPPGHDYASERAANDFAAELLMPRRFVTREYEHDRSTSGLARTFDVSEVAMGYRLMNLGLR